LQSAWLLALLFKSTNDANLSTPEPGRCGIGFAWDFDHPERKETSMQTVEVPREEWTRALDEFSAKHEGWLVSLELLDPSIGAQPEMNDLPLVGVTAEVTTPNPTITIAAARQTDQVTHVIHEPTRVRIERTDQGADLALQVESTDDATAILRFKSAALPETVDGVAR
jgi:uncharacterized protein DUF5335